MDFKIYILFLVALIPLIVGFIWYHQKVFGTIWMQETGMTEEKAKGANMPLIFGLTYLFSLMMSFVLMMLCIHQMHLGSIIMNRLEDKATHDIAKSAMDSFLQAYGGEFRTFKHGLFHGFLSAFCFAFPVIAINAMFERISWKYIAVNAGYFIICCMLMSGFISWLV